MYGGAAVSAEFQRAKSNRLAFLAVCFALMATLLIARLVYWQVVRRGDVLQNAPADEFDLGAVAWRGSIMDRNGHYLAIPSVVYDVGASPAMITDTEQVAGILAPLLGVAEEELAKALSTDASWVPLAKGLPVDKGRAVRDLGILGLKLDLRPGRYYPEGQMAAATLGFVNAERKGVCGVEGRYDARLRGSDGSEAADAPQVLFDLPIVRAPRNGADLVLTIDRVVQRAAEKHLDDALEQYEADSGVIIVMEPHTAAVLAMAIAPGFDPNNYGNVDSVEAYANTAVGHQYEPGSVFKIVTMAAALDAGVVRPGDTYYDAGHLVYGGRTFMNWDREAHGICNMVDVLAYSLNLGSIYVADRLGAPAFYDAVRRFGFGKPTGIDLDAEAPGLIRTPGTENWYPADLATNSFGQGLAVTPIQMVNAVAAVANGGVLMKPYVVDRIMQDGEVVWQATPQPVRRVISEETAATLTAMMADALPIETDLAVVPNYTSAGKTGTAQMIVDGRYDDQVVIASFAGFLPADDPRFVVLVKLDYPRLAPWGSQSAAPVWRDLAGELCAYMGVPPDGARVAGG